nr:MAG TPA: hypothetical protein [Caudoviricetes sp.]
MYFRHDLHTDLYCIQTFCQLHDNNQYIPILLLSIDLVRIILLLRKRKNVPHIYSMRFANVRLHVYLL